MHCMIKFYSGSYYCCIVLEAVTGANGWLRHQHRSCRLRALCDEYGILLISDEVMNGFGYWKNVWISTF